MPRKPTGNPPGRPPRGEPSVPPFSVRLSKELRAALEREAAKKKPRLSLRAEIETRLLHSFEPGFRGQGRLEPAPSAAEFFGGDANYGLAMLLADFIRQVESTTGAGWREDPYTADQVKQGVAAILDTLSPQGEPVPPPTLSKFWQGRAERMWEAVAGGVLHTVESASKLPLDRDGEGGTELVYGDQMKRGALIKRLLGGSIDRAKGDAS